MSFLQNLFPAHREAGAEILPSEGRLPSFEGATGWLNSEPLTPEGLRGRVVAVQFWTYTCVNWLRTLPYVRQWANKYHDHGLSVIGVHTPEFGFERDVENVIAAAQEMRVNYPIALDSNYAVWGAFDNHYWPALYFVDADGIIRESHFGEGRYEQSERVLQNLLGVERELVPVEAGGVEAEADWDHLQTPETYLGDARGERSGSPDRLRLNHWAITGEWSTGPESLVLEEAGGSIAFRFHARDAHLVMSPGTREAIPFRVLLDGEPPGASHGVDIDEEGNGALREGRMHQLVRQHDEVRERTLEITFLNPGAQAYSFTFG
jgi:thiol-disulfide isomerase/thioredoxin